MSCVGTGFSYAQPMASPVPGPVVGSTSVTLGVRHGSWLPGGLFTVLVLSIAVSCVVGLAATRQGRRHNPDVRRGRLLFQFVLLGVVGAAVAALGGVEASVFGANTAAVSVSEFSATMTAWTVSLGVAVPAALALGLAAWKRGHQTRQTPSA
jgi:chromate transport protein ChrA